MLNYLSVEGIIMGCESGLWYKEEKNQEAIRKSSESGIWCKKEKNKKE